MKRRVTSDEQARTHKHGLRARHLRSREELADNQLSSRQICNRLTALPEYQAATTISTYVSMITEVQTLELIKGAWNDQKEVAIPCCQKSELQLFRLESTADLVPRTLGILEPRPELWQQEDRWLAVSRIDLFVVPGVAFDRSGGRLGHGKGYYDRLLAGAHPAVPKIALAFQHQITDRVPMTATDVFMDYVLTEQAVYCCNRE